MSDDIYEIGSQVGNRNQLMPPGYKLWRVEDHFMFVRESDGAESCIDWNRWRVRKDAWASYKKQKERGE